MVGRDPASRGAGVPGRLRRALLGISPREARPERRGFERLTAEATDRLERVGTTFLLGYHSALLDPRPRPLADGIEREVEAGWRGFGYEGVGFGLALTDALFPRFRRRRSRLQEFLAGPGRSHRYLVLVGAGWSLARLPRRHGRTLAGLDPVLRWLCFDGYGFHHGFFAWRRTLEAHWVPWRLRGYARHVFDQGLGRSLWFVLSMDPGRIAAAIDRFPEARRGDLWSGVGLACGFAGGLPEAGVVELRDRAGRWLAHAAQGAAFAAKARGDGGEVTPWLELACSTLWGASAAETKARVEEMGADLPDEGPTLAVAVPAYEVWRRRVRGAFAGAS